MANQKNRGEYYRDQVDIRIAGIFLNTIVSLCELASEANDIALEAKVSDVDKVVAELDDFVRMIAMRTGDRQLNLDYAKAAFGCKIIWTDFDIFSEEFAAKQIRQLEPALLDAELDAIMASHIRLIERLFGNDDAAAELGMTLTAFKFLSMQSVETLLQAKVQDKERFI